MSPASRVAVALILGLAARGIPASAQMNRDGPGRRERPSPAVSFLAGPSSYNLSGTGTAVAAAIRFDVPTGRMFILEPGIGFFRYRTRFGQTIKYLLPEVSFQFQPVGGGVRPYVGVGAGFSEYLSGPGASPGTVLAAAGVRVGVTRTYGFRGEIRVRGLDPFSGQRMTDLSVGLTKRLGR